MEIKYFAILLNFADFNQLCHQLTDFLAERGNLVSENGGDMVENKEGARSQLLDFVQSINL